MLLTVCQSRLKKMPELQPIVALLRAGIDLQWEIRVPTDTWEADGAVLLIEEFVEPRVEEAPEPEADWLAEGPPLSEKEWEAEEITLEAELEVAFEKEILS